MPPLSRAAALLVLLSATCARAQEIQIVQAGAGGRFETQIDTRREAAGVSASQVTALRSRIDGIADMFAAIPEVNSPEAPICRRIYAFIESVPPHGVPSAEVGVMTPINFQNGRCNRMTGGGVVVWLNRASAIIASSHARVRGVESDGRDWFTPRFETWSPEGFTLAGGTTVLTRPDRELYLPVSRERYLREMMRRSGESPAAGGRLARFQAEELPELQADSARHLAAMQEYATPSQVAEMRRMHEESWRIAEEGYARQDAEDLEAESGGRTWGARLAALPPEVAAEQTCLSYENGEPSEDPDCADGEWLWEINPEYFDAAHPDAIQLVVIQADPSPYHGESQAQNAGRREIIRAMDISAFAPRGAQAG